MFSHPQAIASILTNSFVSSPKTGCGKTTLVQRLANLTGRALIVQNLSLQTDSTDLLGGYKPLEMRHVARGVYDKFVDLFVSSFSRSQNAQFLSYVLAAFEKHDWKKLAQCFLKAASMGETKVSQIKHHTALRYAAFRQDRLIYYFETTCYQRSLDARRF